MICFCINLYRPLYYINVITTNFDSSVTHGDTFPPGKAQGESSTKASHGHMPTQCEAFSLYPIYTS